METPTKKVKYDQTWLEEYKLSFKGVIQSEKGPSYAFCQLCNNHFSIRASGRYDIKRHFSTQKHLCAEKAVGSSSLATFFKPASCEDHSVINAEVVFTKFLLEKNIPLAVADDAGDLFRTMFPKSEEAKRYKCARTKTTAIVNMLAGDEKQKTVKNILDASVFSLSTDGGNDSKQKLFPVLARYADFIKEKVVTEIVSVDALDSPSATGKNIFDHIDKVVTQRGLDFSNCISCSFDNANVMVGEKSGVSAFLHNKNPNINIIGCPCHRINLAALKAANALPYKLDQLLIDVYFFLDKSSKRVSRLRELQDIMGTESHEILKHANTRWLSLGPCINRLLEQWEPLSALFMEITEDKSSKSTQSKAQSVFKKLLSSDVKAYALFLSNVIPTFEQANAKLQGNEPLIQKVIPIMKDIIRNLCIRFIKPAALVDIDVTEIELELSNFLPNNEIDIGYKCKTWVHKNLNKEEQEKFFMYIKDYLSVAIKYLSKKCNLDNPALIHATAADPDNKLKASFSSIEYFVDRYPSLLPSHREHGECMDILMRQFREWQTHDFNLEENENADSYWFRMLKIKSQSGVKRFDVLSVCMLGIISIFHSNAECERLFSLVRRNRTDFRQMSNQLLESISICKNKFGKRSFLQVNPSDLLKKAKSATAASLAKQ